MTPQDLSQDGLCALNAILVLKDAKSPLLKIMRKTTALAWYSCHYAITNKRDHTPRFQGRTNKKKGKFDLDYILKTHFVSDAAIEILKRAEPDTDLRLEHIIPWKVVDAKLQSAEINTVDGLRQFLIKNLMIAFVSLEEDERLNKAKLGSSMPNGIIDDPNPYSRYEMIGLLKSGYKLRDDKTGQQTEFATSIWQSFKTA